MNIHIYARVSKDTQDNSLGPQVESCRDEIAHKQKRGKYDGANILEPYIDDGVSASIPLFERPAGHALLVNLQPGDVIVVAKLDRAFRNCLDICRTMDILNQRGVSLIMVDLEIDTSTPNGRCIVQVLAAIKELELANIRERTKTALAWRRKNGLPSGKPPIGWKHSKTPGGKKHYAPCRWTRKLLDWCALKREEGWAIEKIYMHLWAKKCRHPLYRNQKISVTYVKRGLIARANNYPLPNGDTKPSIIDPDQI